MTDSLTVSPCSLPLTRRVRGRRVAPFPHMTRTSGPDGSVELAARLSIANKAVDLVKQFTGGPCRRHARSRHRCHHEIRARAATMTRLCRSCRGTYSIHGRSMLLAQHLRVIVVIAGCRGTATTGHGCGSRVSTSGGFGWHPRNRRASRMIHPAQPREHQPQQASPPRALGPGPACHSLHRSAA
jgi:hypothetical protein